MEVHPERMRQAAAGVTSATEALQTHVDGHRQAMADMASICGDDDLGSLIYGCYQVIHEVAFGSYDDNNGELRNHARNLQAMADNVDMGEEANTVEVNEVAKYL